MANKFDQLIEAYLKKSRIPKKVKKKKYVKRKKPSNYHPPIPWTTTPLNPIPPGNPFG